MAMKQIQAIYREEGKLKELSPKDRLAQRQAIIKPLVDALFVYLKQHQHEVPQSGKLHDAFGEYSCVGVPLFRRNGYRQSGGRKPLFRNRDTALN